MNKEEQLLEKRLIELSNLAFSRDIVTFSDFLNLNELNILHRTPKDQFKARFETYGGYELAERQMVAFLCRTGKYSVSRSHVPGILQCPENTASFHQIPSQS